MLKRIMAKALRQMTRAVFVMGVLTFGTALTVMLSTGQDQQRVAVQGATTDAGWGSEALADGQEGASRLSPIPLANACGMGASSCFKCHNGKRAVAATMDSATAPWHTQHKTVNNSCVGCHQGNPRVMKQDISHKGLIGNPRTDTAAACAGCHSGADMNELNKNYMSLVGGGK
jgi:hypothetical protein